MKKTLFILLLIFAVQVNAHETTLSQKEVEISANVPKLVEVVLTLSFEDLIINQDGIFVNYEGNLLAAYSIERSSEQWVVKAGYCPNNHRIVCRCGGCAISSCGYCCSCFSDYRKP